MSHNYKIMVVLAAIASLPACTQSTGKNPPRPAMIQAVSNSQQLDDVIALLDRGDEKQARKALKTMVKRDPGDSASAKLLGSLDADPVAELGGVNFPYKVQPRETMVSISERFLGQRLKFYSLARYNQIKVPAALKAGQMLRIPGVAPKAPPVVRAPRPEPVAAAPAVLAPVRRAPAVAVPPSDPQRATQLRAAGLAALHQGQVNRAVGLLQGAVASDRSNAAIQRDLNRALRLQATVTRRR